MGHDWPVKTVVECAAPEPYSTQIGPFGKALMADEYTASGVPVLRGVNVNLGRFHDDDFVFISDETADRLTKFESHPGDVLLVHKGTLGQIGLMPKSRKHQRYIMGNSMMRVQCDPAKLLPEYLYYWLLSADGQHYLFSRVSQVGVPQLQTPLTTLRQAALPVPPLREQRAVAGLLSALDDKIELNRRMNETLDAMAQTLFEHWFVDSTEVDKWPCVQLSEIVTTQYGYTASATDVPVGPKLLRVTDINKRPWIEWASVPHCVVDEQAAARYRLRPGDVVVARMADPGKAALIDEPVDAVFASYLVRLQCTSTANAYFVYGYLRSRSYREYAEGATSGSVQKNMNAKVIAAASMRLPPESLLAPFLDVARPLRLRIATNVRESAALAELRDALLPKLISGEIRVRDAEKAVEGAG